MITMNMIVIIISNTKPSEILTIELNLIQDQDELEDHLYLY